MGSGHRESLQLFAVPLQNGSGVFEIDSDFISLDMHRFVKGAGKNNFLAIRRTERPKRKSLSDLRFTRRVKILRIANVDRYSKARVTNGPLRNQLRLTQLRPD